MNNSLKELTTITKFLSIFFLFVMYYFVCFNLTTWFSLFNLFSLILFILGCWWWWRGGWRGRWDISVCMYIYVYVVCVCVRGYLIINYITNLLFKIYENKYFFTFFYAWLIIKGLFIFNCFFSSSSRFRFGFKRWFSVYSTRWSLVIQCERDNDDKA